jgi:hypothetical protein
LVFCQDLEKNMLIIRLKQANFYKLTYKKSSHGPF